MPWPDFVVHPLPGATAPQHTSSTSPISELEQYRFGGLKGLRRHNHFKEVRVADPFQQTILHFPTSLHADNWLVSCFGRSLTCKVQYEPLAALNRGQLLRTRCALLLDTPSGTVADFIAREVDEKSSQAWQKFQVIVRAHGLIPQLRTAQDIRLDVLRLQNLERMRQRLIQHGGDRKAGRAIPLVQHHLFSAGYLTLGELCNSPIFPSLSPESIECAAIHLYRMSVIDMNISEVAYGVQTSIQLL